MWGDVMNFIYVFSHEDRKNLLSKGFNEITECKFGDKESWCFENSIMKTALFSKDEMKKVVITDRAYFI